MELSVVLSAVKRLVSSPTKGGSIHNSLSGNLESYHAFLQEPGQQNLRVAVQTTLENLDVPEWKAARGADEQSQVLRLYCQFTAQGLALLCLLDDALRRAEADDREAAEKAKEQAPLPTKHPRVPPAPKALLAPAEEKSINTVLQFVVSLGLFPFLLPGADHILSLKLGHSISLHKADCLLLTRACYLYHCCRVLTRLFATPVVGVSILPRHLCDALAALLQICYGPTDVTTATQQLQRRKRNEDQCSSFADGDTTRKRIAGEEEQGLSEAAAPSFPVLSSAQRAWCVKELGSLLNRVHQPLVVRELLSLQGMPARPSGRTSSGEVRGGGGGGGGRGLSTPGETKRPVLTSPRWLQRVCGRLLSERLMQKNGIQSVFMGIYGVTAGGGGSGCHGDWRRAQAVAHIIASCPSQAGSVESYYSTVCPQVLDLVRVPMEGGGLRVAAATISAMMRQQPSLARTHLFLPLTSPLRQLTTETEVHSEELAALGKDIEASIANLYKLCGAVEPSSPLLAALVPYLPVLFDLWRACGGAGRKTQDTLRAQVCGVLLSVLSPLDPAAVTSFLRHLAGFPTTQSTDQLVEWVAMAPGIAVQWSQGGGGLCLRTVGKEEEEEEEEEGGGDGEQKIVGAVGERWSVERMESVGQAIVELFVVELKSRGLVGRFFIECLTHVAAVISKDVGFQPETQSVKEEMEALLVRPGAERSDGASSALLTVEQNMTTPTRREAFRRSLALYLTASLSENVSSDILEQANLPRLFEVLSVVMECHAHLTTSGDGSSSPLQLLVAQPDLDRVLGGPISLSIALGYLTAVLGGGKKVERELRPHLSALLQPLETLSAGYPDPELSGLAGDLRVCIATLGAVWSVEMETATERGREGGRGMADKVLSKLREDDDRVENNKSEKETRSKVNKGDVLDRDSSFVLLEKEGRPKRKLVEEISDGVSGSPPLTQSKASAVSGGTQAKPGNRTSFQQCLEELLDPQIPVRGHALATLARLIEARDDEALANSAQLLGVFEENLHHSDSYVYLAAINGLVAMAAVQPRRVLEVLCEEYAMFDDSCSGRGKEEVDRETGQLKPSPKAQAVSSKDRARRKDGEETLDFRLKLGEALVRVARGLGETLPHYSDMMLGAVLASVRDPHPLVRASSLSSLAEMCRLLGHSFGSVHHEVLGCVSSILLTDPEPKVQQAAVLVLTLLLKGQSGHAVQLLGDSLRDVYRLLKQVEGSERDELTRAHVQAALGELDRVMREWIFPQQTLEKKISIL